MRRRAAEDPRMSVMTVDIDPSAGADFVADICEVDSLSNHDPFDVIIAAEVLEHVANPFAAVQTIRSSLARGGSFFASSPFDFRIHGPLPDNWRFTEHGWRQLLAGFGEITIKSVETRRFLMPIAYRIQAEVN